MSSSGKSWILNALGILCTLNNFWYSKGPEYLYQLPLNVLPKQTTCEMKVLKVYIQQWFHDEYGGIF